MLIIMHYFDLFAYRWRLNARDGDRYHRSFCGGASHPKIVSIIT